MTTSAHRLLIVLSLVLAGVLMAPALTAGAASAQTARSGLAVLGGRSMHGDLTPGLATATVFETGWLAGMQVERWLGGGRAGLRLNGLFTQRRLDGASGDYNVYAADVDVLVRLLRVRPTRMVAPYLALGAGATHYADVGGSPVLGSGAYGDHPVRAHAWAGLGFDIAPASGADLRVEVADKIVFPSIGVSPPASGLPMVHNLVVTTGVQLRIGRLQRESAPEVEPAVISPAPAPETAVEADGADRDVYTVQIGAFMEWDTARLWRDRLAERGLPVWLVDTEIQGEPLSRVRVGAFHSEDQAAELATALERDYGWRVQVDRVAPDEAVPADALDGSWANLQGNGG